MHERGYRAMKILESNVCMDDSSVNVREIGMIALPSDMRTRKSAKSMDPSIRPPLTLAPTLG